LEKPRNERAVTEDSIEEREQKGIERQSVKRAVIAPMPLEDLFRPVIVKLHVAAAWKEQRGGDQSDEDDQPHEKHRGENVMPDAESLGPNTAETIEAD
jgi:hypothetical protein